MAAAAYYDAVQKLYIAYYGRPADPLGLQYWSNEIEKAGGKIDAVVNAFGNSDEAKAIYGDLGLAAQINNVYQNILGRPAETGGLTWYAQEIQAGRITLAGLAQAVIDGASGADATVVANKLVVAKAFTDAVDDSAQSIVDYNGEAAADIARDFLATVTADTDSVTAATGNIASTVSSLNGALTGETFTLTTGIDNIVGTAGNDVITATNTGTSIVLGGLDAVDGGAGNDTLSIADTNGAAAGTYDFALPTGFSIKNVEVLKVTTNGAIGTKGGAAFDISNIAGLTSANLVAAGAGSANGSNVKAAGTTDVNLTVAGSNQIDIAGGKAVTTNNGGVVNVTGNALTSVTVNKASGLVTIDNVGTDVAATTAAGTTLTSVTLNSVDANSAVKGAALTGVTVKGATTAARTVTVTNGTANHSLTVNVDGTGYKADGTAVQTVVADANAKTITVNATGSKSSLALTGSTAATTVNVTGSADLTLAALASATKLDGSAATGSLTLGTLAAGTVTVSTGSGNDTLGIAATTKTTVNTGAGNDAVTLTSALAAGSTINLGAGNDKLLVTTGSVAASTATDITVIDGGDGVDTLAASLINAANAAQFKNFEAIDLSSATGTALDVELMTGSTISGLTLSGGAGGATVNNVAAGVGLSVSGANTGISTIGVKGAATGTADSFAITFAGTAGSAATAASPDAVNAGTVVTNGVEKLSVASSGTGFVANTLKVTDDGLQQLTITGDKALNLTFTGTNGTNVAATGGAVNLIDGSAATGKLNIDTTNVTADNKVGVGLTVKGGSADDTITLAQKATVVAGAGDDVIHLAAAGGTVTGGAGNDTIDVTLAVATGTTEATSVLTTVTDAAAGDIIKFAAGASGAFETTKVALGASVTNLDLALAAAVTTANDVSWFQYGNNTYVVADLNGSGTFNAGDAVVKLTGLVDLSHATLSGAELTLA